MNKTISILLLLAVAAVSILLVSCSDLKKNLPTATTLTKTIHPGGWNDTASTSFHGKTLLAQLRVDSSATSACMKCHGVTVKKTCSDCHGTSYPHSTAFKSATFDSTTNTSHHAFYLRNHSWNVAQCQACHGSDYKGGTSGKSCYACHATYPHITSVWADSSNAQFHGQRVKSRSWSAAECQVCHGTTYAGGFSGQSCFACHGTYPHTTTWIDSTNGQFHGTYLKNKSFAAAECQACHGANYQGGRSNTACYTCHASYPHLASWIVPASGVSHGQYVKNAGWSSGQCQTCHGANYQGGISGQSCYTCHSTYPHVASMATAHPGVLQTTGYPLVQCQSCHGAAYTGGSITNFSCEKSGCHQDASNTPKSPEACNTCHGQFRGPANNALTYAPPEDVIGDTAATVAAVGAHQKHLVTTLIASPIPCATCHVVPATTFASVHLNGAGQPIQAEVNFTAMASHVTAVTPVPSYSFSTNKCSNTYCHGNWRLRASESANSWIYTDSVMVGANFSPKWNGGPSQAACGTCHGLPPTGHDNSDTNCGDCHSEIDASNPFHVVDPTKHMNGVPDL